MEPFTPKSSLRQLTEHLRSQIPSGKIEDTMPGVSYLVRRLGVGTQTVISAIAVLS